MRWRGQSLLSPPLPPAPIMPISVTKSPIVSGVVGAAAVTPFHPRRIVEDVETRIYRPGHGAALADMVMEHETSRLNHALCIDRKDSEHGMRRATPSSASCFSSFI